LSTLLHSKTDPFYGHEHMAWLCMQFITYLFAYLEYPPTITHSQAKLPIFIVYALPLTNLHASVMFASLSSAPAPEGLFPTAQGSLSHYSFILVLMIASKVICNDTYSSKSRSIITQDMFTLREINCEGDQLQMEQEICNYLNWELTIDNHILSNF
ncbi:hypothetical protein K435DRAFT_679112, partial [Dendrothele bispora CBS 962.96]